MIDTEWPSAIGPKAAHMRNIYVDWLRGLSIFLVLCVHGVVSPTILFFFPQSLILGFATNGAYGVTIFFVISGFLITSRTLQRYGEPRNIVPADFYILRVGRILPLLLLFLFVMVCLFFAGIQKFVPQDPDMIYRAIVSALTFQYNQFYMTENGNSAGLYAMAPLWSLSIEEIFYIAFPIVLTVLRWRSLIALALVIMIIQAPDSRQFYSIYSSLGCVDALAFGCLTAMLVNWLRLEGRSLAIGPILMVAGLAVIFEMVGYRSIMEDLFLGPSIVAFGASLFLLGSSFSAARGQWSYPQILRSIRSPLIVIVPFAVLGALSYEIYLFHLAYHFLTADHLMASPIKQSLFSLGVLVASAALLNRYFSEPMNKAVRSVYESRPLAIVPSEQILAAAAE